MTQHHYVLTLPTIAIAAEEFTTAMACYGALTVTVLELRGLVCISEMPEESRKRLLAGLEHIEGHVIAELRQLIEDSQQRSN